MEDIQRNLLVNISVKTPTGNPLTNMEQQVGGSARRMKEGLDKVTSGMGANAQRAAELAMGQLNRLQKRIEAMSSVGGLAKEATFDMFGIRRASRDMDQLAGRMEMTMLRLQNQSAKVAAGHGDPTQLMRGLRMLEGAGRQMQTTMMGSMQAVEHSFQRGTGGLMEFGRGMSLLANGNQTMEALVTKAIKIDALFSVIRGGKEAFVGLAGGIANAVQAFKAFNAAQALSGRMGGVMDSVRTALAARAGGGGGGIAGAGMVAGMSLAGSAGSAALMGGGAAVGGGSLTAGGAALTGGGALTAGGGAAAGAGAAGAAGIGIGGIAAAAGLAALPVIVGAVAAVVGTDPRIQNAIVNATKHVPILSQIFGSAGIAAGEVRGRLQEEHAGRRVGLAAAESESRLQAAQQYQPQIDALQARIAASQFEAGYAPKHAAEHVAEMRYQRQGELFQQSLEGVGHPAPARGVFERLTASRRSMSGEEAAQEARSLRAEIAGLSAGPIAAPGREQVFERLAGGVHGFAGGAGGLAGQNEERRLRISALQGRLADVTGGRATVAGGARWEAAAAMLGPEAERATASAEFQRQRAARSEAFDRAQPGDAQSRQAVAAAQAAHQDARARLQAAEAVSATHRREAGGVTGPGAAQAQVTNLTTALSEMERLQRHAPGLLSPMPPRGPWQPQPTARELEQFHLQAPGAAGEERRGATSELRRLMAANPTLRRLIENRETGGIRTDAMAQAEVRNQLRFARHTQQASGAFTNQHEQADQDVVRLRQEELRTAEQVLATERARQAIQIQRLQASAQELQNAANMARQEAAAARSRQQSTRENFALMDVDQQMRAIAVGRRIRAGGEVDKEELQFLRGVSGSEELIRLVANRRANRTGQSEVWGGIAGQPQAVRRAEEREDQLQGDADARRRQSEEAVIAGAAQEADRLNNQIIPAMQTLGNQLGDVWVRAVDKLVSAAEDRLNQRLQEIRANRNPA